MATRRLDAFLSHCGVGSRSEVTRLIRARRVTLDGVVCRSAKQHVADGQVVTLDGAELQPPPEELHLLMYKPTGYAVGRDLREAPLFSELLPAQYAHLPLQPAGRLDRDTSGLLLVTTSGALIQRLTHPRRAHEKRYRVAFSGELPADAVARFADGITLDDDPRPTLPAVLMVYGPGRATAVLHEGRYHQVRRMFAALGCQVTALHRDRIGALDLPGDLTPGDCRQATEDELSAISEASESTSGA